MIPRSDGKTALGYFVFGILALYAYIPVTWALGLASFTSHPVRAGHFVNLILFAVLVSIVLVLPVTRFVYPQLAGALSGRDGRFLRVGLIVALLGAPLVSFAYYLDGLTQLTDVHEVSLNIVLSVALGVLFFERTGRASLFAGFLFAATAIPFFFVNDVLSSNTVLFAYFSHGSSFYLWRTLLPIAGFWALLGWMARGEAVSRKSLGCGLLALGAYSLAARIVLPTLYTLLRGGEAPVSWDLWWALYLIGGIFCFRGGRIAHYALGALVVARLLTVLWEIRFELAELRAGYWELSLFANHLFELFAMIWLGVVLFRFFRTEGR